LYPTHENAILTGEYYTDSLNARKRLAHRFSAPIAVVAVLLAGCATAERFGEDRDDPDAPPLPQAECEEDDDCWDGDPATEDLCGDDGLCEFLPVEEDPDTDTGGGDDECDVALGFDEEGTFELFLDSHMAEVSHTAPLSMGKLAKIHLRDPSRIWIDARRDGREDVMMVLLRDCANAAVNRIAWGERIYTEELPAGDYYLAVFSEMSGVVAMEARFLVPTYCDGAQALAAGSLVDSVDGLADDFDGSCVEDEDLEHRGDKVYSFKVPKDKLWDVSVDLYPEQGEPRHYLYLTQGCGADASDELICSDEIADARDNHATDAPRVGIQAQKLKAGTYFLYVDTVDADLFDAGSYELVFRLERAASF